MYNSEATYQRKFYKIHEWTNFGGVLRTACVTGTHKNMYFKEDIGENEQFFPFSRVTKPYRQEVLLAVENSSSNLFKSSITN